MAKKYRFEVDADTKGASSGLEGVGDKLSVLSKQAGALTDNLGKVGKGAPGMEKAFKGIGMSIKSAVASLGAVAFIFELFRNNQKIIDIFNVAMTSIQYIFNNIMEILSPLTDAIMKLFTNPREAIQELGGMIKKWVINYFQQVWDIIKNVGGALANLFTFDWQGLKENLKEIGTSIGDAILGTEGATEKLVENVKEAVAQGVLLVDLLNRVKIAEAELEKLREQGDLRLERLRQFMDDEQKSIDSRIKANEELGKALEEQILAELKIAKLKTEAARQESIKSGLIDDQAEYIRAQANEIAIMNRLESQRSEQLMNTNSLLREQRDIQKGIIETEEQLAELRDEQARLAIKTEAELLAFDLEVIERRKKAALQAITDELAGVQVGTARYQELLNERAIVEAEARRDAAVRNQEYNDLVAEQNKTAQEKELERISAFAKKLRDQAAQEKADRQANMNFILDTTEAVLGAAGEIAGEHAGAQKAINIAEATMNTYKGATQALASAPPPYNFIMAAAVTAAGLANVIKIARTKVPKDRGSASVSPSGAGGDGGGGRTPGTFSIVQPLAQSLSQNLAGNLAGQPTRAYVVLGDIESAAELDRTIKANAR